ncbi:MAG: hypothetical protein WDW36_003280 [Sanguina aurantia]
MNPDHPLLRRAQDALRRQLVANKTRLEDDLREKQSAVKSAKLQRESIGVELYGFQQTLAKLQLALEQTHQNYVVVSGVRSQAETNLSQLRGTAGSEELGTKKERGQVEKFQSELDRLSATLKQIEGYNEAMKGEIAVTRRAAYAAEEAASKQERAKMVQDFRIDTMQEDLKSAQQSLALHSAQAEAQRRETRAAMETLAEAETEMESVHFEKKQLVAQWRGSLLAIQRRDEALSAIQDSVREQQQQALSIEQEIAGYRKDVVREAVRGEQLSGVLRKVEADTQFVVKQPPQDSHPAAILIGDGRQGEGGNEQENSPDSPASLAVITSPLFPLSPSPSLAFSPEGGQRPRLIPVTPALRVHCGGGPAGVSVMSADMSDALGCPSRKPLAHPPACRQPSAPVPARRPCILRSLPLTSPLPCMEVSQEKGARLQEMYAKLAKSLEHTEEQIKRASGETKAVRGEAVAVERAAAKITAEVRTIEEETLAALGEQTTAGKSSSKTAGDTLELRRRVREEEMLAVETENELAKLQIDILNTEAHNTRLLETLRLLNEELQEKAHAIEKYEVEIRRRNDEVEKKTREIDLLNRRYERMADLSEGEEVGPLEATIKNLGKEVEGKGGESKDLQRRWISCQTELVGLQNENSGMAETLTRMRAEHTVLFQKRARLESQLACHGREVREMGAGMGRLNVELQRVNALIAANSSARQALQEDNFNLESRIMADLRGLEEESAKLTTQIEAGRQAKRDTLSEIVEVERQIMLWERKIELEREMQEVLDPAVGQDVAAEMRKEIHRMQLRHGELVRLQESLMQDMEKALGRRELIHLKGRASVARAKASQGETLTRTQLGKAVGELAKSVRDTEKEMSATDARIASLNAQRVSLAAGVAASEASCRQLQGRGDTLASELTEAVNLKYRLLLATTRLQRTAKRYEDVESGRYRPAVEDSSQTGAELERSTDRLSLAISVLEQLRMLQPHLAGELDRVLCHVAAL